MLKKNNKKNLHDSTFDSSFSMSQRKKCNSFFRILIGVDKGKRTKLWRFLEGPVTN